jgi:hypothetical protein
MMIQAPSDVVYRLAAEVEFWPAFVPSIRFVRVLRRDPAGRPARLLACGGWHGWIPVTWHAVQHLEPERGRILYRQVGGLSAGATAEWRIDPSPGGAAAEVTIVQRPAIAAPGVESSVARRFVGPVSGSPVVDAVLADLRRVAEGASLRGAR